MSQEEHTRVNKIFPLIASFVSDAEECFGNTQHSLRLYNRLLTKNVNTDQERLEHVSIFSKYVQDNYQAILTKDAKKLTSDVIFFSKKINIKLGEIFKKADNDTTEAIWRHLLVISTAVDPSSDAMNVLKKSMEEKSNEGNFLTNIMNKIQTGVDPNVNDPMSAIMGLMSSGVLTELMSSMSSGMSNGQLDVSKLFGLVQGMIGQFTQPPAANMASSAATGGESVEESKDEVEELIPSLNNLAIEKIEKLD